MSKDNLLIVPLALAILILAAISLALYSRVSTLQDQDLRREEQVIQLQTLCREVSTQYEIEAISHNAWRQVKGQLSPRPLKRFPC